jgi:hypothetical protein
VGGKTGAGRSGSATARPDLALALRRDQRLRNRSSDMSVARAPIR